MARTSLGLFWLLSLLPVSAAAQAPGQARFETSTATIGLTKSSTQTRSNISERDPDDPFNLVLDQPKGQPGSDRGAPSPASTATATTGEAPAELNGAGWYALANAFTAHLDGDAKLARRRLLLLREEQPDTELGQSALRLLERMEELGYGVEDPIGSRKPSALARAELAIFQTSAGIAGGAFACAAIDECDDARTVVAFVAGGGMLGLAGSLIFTGDGISAGRVLAINHGTTWGMWNGLAFGIAVDGIRDEGTFVSMFVGQLIGVGAGIGAALYFDPRAGDVAFPTSAGIWTAGITAMALGLSNADFDANGFFAALMIMSDLGLAAGAIVAAQGWYPVSRGRSLLIDSGGIVGTLLGVGLPILIQGDNVDETPVFASGLIGMVAGLAATTYFTRNWDTVDTDVSLGLAPIPDGMAAIIGGKF